MHDMFHSSNLYSFETRLIRIHLESLIMLGKRDILLSLIQTLCIQQLELRRQLLEAIQRLRDSISASILQDPNNLSSPDSCSQALAGMVSQIRARLEDNHQALIRVETMLSDYDTIELPHLKTADLLAPISPSGEPPQMVGGNRKKRWSDFLFVLPCIGSRNRFGSSRSNRTFSYGRSVSTSARDVVCYLQDLFYGVSGT